MTQEQLPPPPDEEETEHERRMINIGLAVAAVRRGRRRHLAGECAGRRAQGRRVLRVRPAQLQPGQHRAQGGVTRGGVNEAACRPRRSFAAPAARSCPPAALRSPATRPASASRWCEFEPSSTTPPIIAASAATAKAGTKSTSPTNIRADPQRSGGDGNLGGQRNLAAALDRFGQVLDARLDARDVVGGNVVAGRPHAMTPHSGVLLLK